MFNKFEFSYNYVPHTYTKKSFIVYLKIKYYRAFCILSGNPISMQDPLSPFLMSVPREIDVGSLAESGRASTNGGCVGQSPAAAME